MKEVLRLAFITTLVICGSIMILLEAMPQWIPMIFGIDDAALMANSVIAVRIYTAGMIITTVNVVISYYLQSIEQTLMSAVIVSLRNFVLLLCAVFVLGKLFGMNGIWAAYPVAEVLTFLVGIGMICAKQKKLEKTGKHIDIFLLDETVEGNTECYTYDSMNDTFPDFCDIVLQSLAKRGDRCGEMAQDAENYLLQLG